MPPIVSQVKGLSGDIPGYLDDLRKNDQFRKYDEKYDITKKLNEQAKKLPTKLGDAAGALQSVTVGVFSAAVQLITVLTIVFFLLLDGGRLVDCVLRLLGPVREARFRRIADDVYHAVAGYVAGNLIISVIAGTTTYVTLTLLNVPFAVPLAVLMAFLDLIPLVGATIGGILIGLVTLFTDFPTSTLIWVVVFIVYQQVENNVLQPIVYRRTVNVPPLLVIVAILIGGVAARRPGCAGGDPDRRRGPDRRARLVARPASGRRQRVAGRRRPGGPAGAEAPRPGARRRRRSPPTRASARTPPTPSSPGPDVGPDDRADLGDEQPARSRRSRARARRGARPAPAPGCAGRPSRRRRPRGGCAGSRPCARTPGPTCAPARPG